VRVRQRLEQDWVHRAEDCRCGADAERQYKYCDRRGAGLTSAQLVPSAKKAARVRITQGPEIELAKDHLTIITWTTNNPGETKRSLFAEHSAFR
jgi:hypothetical protein